MFVGRLKTNRYIDDFFSQFIFLHQLSVQLFALTSGLTVCPNILSDGYPQHSVGLFILFHLCSTSVFFYQSSHFPESSGTRRGLLVDRIVLFMIFYPGSIREHEPLDCLVRKSRSSLFLQAICSRCNFLLLQQEKRS